MKLGINLFLGFLFFYNLNGISFLSEQKAKNAYLKEDYKKAREILEKEQIDDPENPELNYNLGNIYYRLQNFNDAKSSFQRAINNCLDSQIILRKKSLFNLGNTYYKNCLHFLGPEWEKKDLNIDLLEKAIAEVKASIDNYQKIIDLDFNDEKTNFNKKQAQELLKKLEEKKKKEENNQQQNKNNQKDQNDSDNKSENSQNNNQNNKQKNSSEKERSNENKQNDNKSSSSNESNSDQKGKSGQQDNENSNGNQQESEGENKSDNTESRHDQRKDEMLNKNETSKEEQTINKENKHSKSSQMYEDNMNTTNKNNMRRENGKQALEKKEQVGVANEESKQNLSNDFKEKGMRVLLDKLQTDESKLQKMLIMQKSKNFKPIVNDKQKPW